MPHRSVVGPKGKVTIPKELREKYHLLEGEAVVILPASDGILLKHPQIALRGRLKGKIDLRGLEEDLKDLRKQWRI